MKTLKKLAKLLPVILLFAVSLAAGIFIGRAIYFPSAGSAAAKSFAEVLFDIAVGIVLFVIVLFIHIILHEGGHLVFGLATGYRFLSFRVGSIVLQRGKDGKYSIKRFNLAGTGGQCLLSPPDMVNGTFPCILYNLGGSLVNIIVAALCLVLRIVCSPSGIADMFLFYMFVYGFLTGLLNLIPLKLDMVANDGYNTLMLIRDANARRALWLQLKINEQQTHGIRLRDMPAEWFEPGEGADMKNPIISAIGVFAENRYMDAHDFAAAREQINYLTKTPAVRITGLYRELLKLDELFLDILEKGGDADLSLLSDKQTKKFMQQMKYFPSVIRTEYAAAAVKGEEAAASAHACLERFEKCAASYPSEADIASERELMALVRPDDTNDRQEGKI